MKSPHFKASKISASVPLSRLRAIRQNDAPETESILAASAERSDQKILRVCCANLLLLLLPLFVFGGLQDHAILQPSVRYSGLQNEVPATYLLLLASFLKLNAAIIAWGHITQKTQPSTKGIRILTIPLRRYTLQP